MFNRSGHFTQTTNNSRLKTPKALLLTLCALCLATVTLPSFAAKVGQSAPTTELESITGGPPVDLADYKGQVVLVDFWASWCPPCIKSLPLFNEMRTELKDYGFEVLAINMDEDKNEGLKFYNKLGVSFPSGYDPTGKMAELWGVEAMPTSFLVDRQGKVRMEHKGFKEKDLPHLREKIMTLIRE